MALSRLLPDDESLPPSRSHASAEPCSRLRDLNGIYAQAFNRRHGRDGHLFQGRYRAVLIDDNEHLLTAVAYIVRNPVRAAICPDPADWRWSSHHATLGMRPPGVLAIDELLSHLAPTRSKARELYRDLTETAARDELASYDDGVIDGSAEFTHRHLDGVYASSDIPSRHVRLPRPALEQALAGGSVEAIAAAYSHGYTMPAIARLLGLHPSTVSRRFRRHRAQIKT